jgi:hypothetical protein
MLGYWAPECPVKADQEGVLATVYRKKGKALISIASWAKQPVRCKLTINWSALGLNPTSSTLSAQSIPGFQGAAEFGIGDEIPLEPGRGWLLMLKEKTS